MNSDVLLVFLREIVRGMCLNDENSDVQMEMTKLHECGMAGEESISTSNGSAFTYEGKAGKVAVLEM